MNDIDRTIYDLIVNWPDSTPITAGTVADKLGIPRSRKQIERPLGRLWRLGKLVRKENNSRNFVYSIPEQKSFDMFMVRSGRVKRANYYGGLRRC